MNEQQEGVIRGRSSGERGGASPLWKLCALLLLMLLMADLLTRQIGLLTGSARDPAPATPTVSFKVQVGDFRAEIRWDSLR